MPVDDVPDPVSKRDRLLAGARRAFYMAGVERTTLADVAEASGVPVGNVYYYFKTKDELASTTVASFDADLRAILGRAERKRTPQARLKAFLDEMGSVSDCVADHGCPFGTLASELDKHAGTVPCPESGRLLVPLIDWAELQFRVMGQREARELAIHLIAGYEGAALLTHSLRDPQLLRREVRRISGGSTVSRMPASDSDESARLLWLVVATSRTSSAHFTAGLISELPRVARSRRRHNSGRRCNRQGQGHSPTWTVRAGRTR